MRTIFGARGLDLAGVRLPKLVPRTNFGVTGPISWGAQNFMTLVHDRRNRQTDRQTDKISTLSLGRDSLRSPQLCMQPFRYYLFEERENWVVSSFTNGKLRLYDSCSTGGLIKSSSTASSNIRQSICSEQQTRSLH